MHSIVYACMSRSGSAKHVLLVGGLELVGNVGVMILVVHLMTALAEFFGVAV